MATINADDFANPIGAGNGGTGVSTITAHCPWVGSGTSPISILGIGAAHSLMVGNTSADPSMTTSGTPYVSGISFDSGSHTMSTYVVGTWTPTISFNVSTGTLVYTTQQGTYVKIGQRIFFSLFVQMSSIGVSSGVLLFNNMPFTTLNSTPSARMQAIAHQGVTFPGGATYIRANMGANQTTCSPAFVGSNFVAIGVNFTNLSNTFAMSVTGNYYANS